MFIKIYQVIFVRFFLHIMTCKYNIYKLHICYIVYRKDQSKIRVKSKEKTEREYGLISQIIKKKCYL